MSGGSDKLNDFKGIKSHHSNYRDFARLENSSDKECEWVDKAVSLLINSKNPAVKEYIVYCLARIKVTADKIHLALMQTETGQCNTLSLEGSLAKLLRTYSFIENHFAGAVPSDYDLPIAYLDYTFPMIIGENKKIIHSLSARYIKAELLNAVTGYLNSTVQSGSGISRRQLNYLKSFLEELNSLISAPVKACSDALFADMLRAMNFNHLAVLSWFQDQIYGRLDKTPRSSERLCLIAAELESLRRLPPAMPDPCYKDQPAVDVFIKNLLEEEFRQQVISNATAQPLRQHKLRLNLSVAQIAFLLRLLYNEGIFKSSNVTDLLRFAVANFCSKRQDDFSFRNLSKEYYSASQVTAAGLRDLLHKMIACINKNYFPFIAATGLVNYIS